MPQRFVGRNVYMHVGKLPDDVRSALRSVAASEHRSVSATIRTMIDEGLARRGALRGDR
jgi:plasmid stability protein